ncbi:MAG: DUF5615 family PIN-like protein [Chthoniobacteraceae bacterium]
MKFILDAHLPPSLREIFARAGHEALHTLDLPERNSSPDSALNAVSMADQRVVVTKDTAFITRTCCMVARGSWCWCAQATWD